MADDLYIDLPRYGRENLADGVTREDTLAHLRKLHPEAGLVESENRFTNTFFQVFQLIAGSDSGSGIQRYTLSMEGYFNLLEHEELNQARQSSQNALWVAVAAITISGLLSVASVLQSAL